MDKFYKEFYASRLEDWKNKYIKLLELRKLVKLIVKDIEKHGGKITRKQGRYSIFEDTRNSRPSIQLDRHSVGLSVFEDKENLFDKNDPIFETPVMYEIENTFDEIDKLSYSDDIKIFLYFLQIEIHNVYVFYLNQEKEIYNRTNEHLYKRKHINEMNESEVLEELNDLTEIAYLTYSFYLYSDLNIEAIHQILKYFDEHFISINNNTSLHKLFFKKYLSQNESDLKYILNFKIVIESTALLESYRKELIKLYPKNDDIKTQAKELNEVLSYLIAKNTDRVNEDIYEVYNSNEKGGVTKQKKNIDVDIQNSYFIDVHKADDYLKTLEESQYDKKMRIKMTTKNKLNIAILFIYIVLNSIYYIIPYSLIYLNFNGEKDSFKYFGVILCSTHIGTLLSRSIYSYFTKFKKAYIFYCICFIFSFIFMILPSFIDSNLGIINICLLSMSRFLLGLSNERIITRKYFILFIPESKMRCYSAIFLSTSYFGFIIGVSLIFFIERFPIFINIKKELFLHLVGLIISIVHLLLIIIFFTEPNIDEKGNMLTQKILSISQVTDDVNEEDYKEYKDISKKDDRYEVKINDKDKLKEDKSNSFILAENDHQSLKKEDEEGGSSNLIGKNNEKVISKEELKGLNSLEEDIIKMNDNSHFDDVNLLGNELERIKNNQINNNKAFRKSFLSFIITLFLCNMINEYILIKTPFILRKIYPKFEMQKIIVPATFIILILLSFPLIVFCRIIKKFDIEKRLLLIFYILVFIILVSIFLFNHFEKSDKKYFLSVIFVVYLINNFLEGITHLLIEKIIPSFVKFCGKNMKSLFSHSIHFGKALGDFSFFLFYFFLDNTDNKLGKIEAVFFMSLTFIFFIISFACYKSLRVRAFAKLRYFEN